MQPAPRPELVSDEDTIFDHDDRASSPPTHDFLEKGFALAERVHAELAAQWVVTTTDSVTRADVVLPVER
ncbi:hypothetical protein [Arthrobacter sp. 31Y]|uniref:hypothetical protein n=1 Tax=Arthrobacter sp. 31Y TaxID=1115632 RepID=UPI000464A55F|nr:hypothetical protein [Arthrobacter sp. 31Y]